MAKNSFKEAAQKLRDSLDEDTMAQVISVGISNELPDKDIVVLVCESNSDLAIPDSFQGYSVGVVEFDGKCKNNRRELARGLPIIDLD